MADLIALDKLTRRFTREDGSDLSALDGIDLHIDSSHHMISLIGPDGSGKSTLLKIIAGIDRPDEGTFSLFLDQDQSPHGNTIGYMSQNLGLYEDLSVGVNLRLFCKLRDFDIQSLRTDASAEHGIGRGIGRSSEHVPAQSSRPCAAGDLSSTARDSSSAASNSSASDGSMWSRIKGLIGLEGGGRAGAGTETGGIGSCAMDSQESEWSTDEQEAALDAYLDDLLTQVGLIKFKDYKAGSLSGGMKQKLALTCAISARPGLLLLDEPTVGVDPISRRELWAIITDYLERTGSYCIFSSLYLEEAEKGSLTIFIKNGRLIYSGSAQELRDRVASQCFALSPDSSLSYQQVARTMMCQLERSHCIMDLCPRMGRIDLLTRTPVSPDELNSDLESLFAGQEGPFSNLSRSRWKLSARDPVLEDAYINLTSSQPDEHGHDAGSAAAADFTPDSRHQDRAELTAQQHEELKDESGREVIISVDGIRKTFGSFTAVHDSNFKVYRGEIFGLLGPNGAGKTTTFRMICSLLNPSAGTILINNMELKNAKSSVRATIGYVAQKFCLYRKLTARQNLEYFGQSYGLTGHELDSRISLICSVFGLTPFLNIISVNLPFGIQRSLSMACALIHRPSILFLDEATSGADPTSRRAFWSMIARLAAHGTTVIVTTHFMEEAEYCDRFLIQDQGKILILGTPDEICVHGSNRISIEEAFVNCVMERRNAS